MKKILALVVFLGLTSLSLVAQDTSKVDPDFSKVDVFGGYQYTHLGSAISPVASAQGWDGSFTYNINKNFGVTADINGAYQTVSGSYIGVSGSFPGHYYSFAGGPTYSFTSKGKFKPYVHALFGDARVSSSASADGVTVSASSNGFTTLIGGGLDMRLSRHLALRLVQADWVYYHFGLTGTSSANTFKVATGVVYRFGGK